jgi:hypothetical protein
MSEYMGDLIAPGEMRCAAIPMLNPGLAYAVATLANTKKGEAFVKSRVFKYYAKQFVHKDCWQIIDDAINSAHRFPCPYLTEIPAGDDSGHLFVQLAHWCKSFIKTSQNPEKASVKQFKAFVLDRIQNGAYPDSAAEYVIVGR